MRAQEGDKSLALYGKQQAAGLENVFTFSPLSSAHLLLRCSKFHPRKILLVVLEIGKVKDLSAPLRTYIFYTFQ
jgi:hypothetical protein